MDLYGIISHKGCWENKRKVYKPVAFGSGFTAFRVVLPISRVVYYADINPEKSVLLLKYKKRMRTPVVYVLISQMQETT